MSFLRSLCLLLLIDQVYAEQLSIAVASNFVDTIKQLAAQFEQQSGHQLSIIPGATGKQYAQIEQGAPFDLFFAADAERPKLLEQHGKIIAGSRFTYARGRLVLWSPDVALVDAEARVLMQSQFDHLAIASPKLAPYGLAAQQALMALGLWDQLSPKLVQGENIGQAFHFIGAGHAQLGLVAQSQVLGKGGSSWLVPEKLHEAIEQQAVVLTNKPAAKEFAEYVQTPHARTLIKAAGYE